MLDAVGAEATWSMVEGWHAGCDGRVWSPVYLHASHAEIDGENTKVEAVPHMVGARAPVRVPPLAQVTVAIEADLEESLEDEVARAALADPTVTTGRETRGQVC